MEIGFCRLFFRLSHNSFCYRSFCNSTYLAISVFSSNTMSTNSSTQSIKNQFSWLNKLAPCFGVNGKQVEVIRDPSVFFNTLLKEISKSKERIVLASLYLGTSPLEKKLVNYVYNAMSRERRTIQNHSSTICSAKPKVEILLDYNRGSRGSNNSRLMLTPLLRDFPEQVRVSLFHTPDLHGLQKRMLPERYNEVIGLQHMKIYIFDDNVMLSGANLSESYFTNRQDRYVVIRECRHLADFFHRLVSRVSSLSFSLKADNTLELSEGLKHHPFQSSGEAYRKEAKQQIEDVIDPMKCALEFDKSEQVLDGNHQQVDTWIYPLIQMGPFGITQDYIITQRLFQEASEASHIKLASGYFNLTNEYMSTILHQSLASFDILTASPEANGFYGAKGISGYIPDTYTCITKQFLESVCTKRQHERIHLQEYKQPGWTFHAKGLWYYPPLHVLPVMTLIGSPNFGYRSVYRDLEAQVAIVTDNLHLRKQFHQEQHELYSKSTSLTLHILDKRHDQVPLWVKLIKPVIRNFF